MSKLSKVQHGQKLHIPAATFNSFIDAAQAHERSRQGIGGSSTPTFSQASVVLVRNDSGGNVDRFGVLGIDVPIITPTANESEFKNRVALSCITPAAGTHEGRFVVLAEPIADGRVGRAYAAGVCPVQLDVSDEDFGFADVSDGDATVLETCRGGSACVLWKESGTGTVWGLVRLGVAPGVDATYASPAVLGGSGETADTDTWDVTDPPADTE